MAPKVGLSAYRPIQMSGRRDRVQWVLRRARLVMMQLQGSDAEDE